MNTCACVLDGLKLMLGVFLDSSLPSVVETGSLTEPEVHQFD